MSEQHTGGERARHEDGFGGWWPDEVVDAIATVVVIGVLVVGFLYYIAGG